jgi:hypothetical protein
LFEYRLYLLFIDLIVSKIFVIVLCDVELPPELEVTSVPELSLPEPEFVVVIVMGAIQTAPPKFTIPPEMVPIEIPSRLIANLSTPSTLFYYYMDKMIKWFKLFR